MAISSLFIFVIIFPKKKKKEEKKKEKSGASMWKQLLESMLDVT